MLYLNHGRKRNGHPNGGRREGAESSGIPTYLSFGSITYYSRYCVITLVELVIMLNQESYNDRAKYGRLLHFRTLDSN